MRPPLPVTVTLAGKGTGRSLTRGELGAAWGPPGMVRCGLQAAWGAAAWLASYAFDRSRRSVPHWLDAPRLSMRETVSVIHVWLRSVSAHEKHSGDPASRKST